MWTCPKCGSKVDVGFDVCWQCGTSRDGAEDPSFVRADDAAPIEDPIYDPIADPGPKFPGPVDAVAGSADLVECYQALSLMEAKFLADQLNAEGIAAVSDTMDLQDALGTWQGNPRVYCRAEDLAAARTWLEGYEIRRRVEHGPADEAS
jgi:hypothetical protein